MGTNKKQSRKSVKVARDPKPIEEILGRELLPGVKKDPQPTLSLLKSADLIALYFGHGRRQDGDCLEFTPKLIELYSLSQKSKVGNDSKDGAIPRLEIVYVSADKTVPKFEEYYATMPWLSFLVEAGDSKAALATELGIRRVPAVVILNKRAQCLDAEAHPAIDKCQTDEDRVAILRKWMQNTPEEIQVAVLKRGQSKMNRGSFLKVFVRQVILIFILILLSPTLSKYYNILKVKIRESRSYRRVAPAVKQSHVEL